jgi:soluble lytic murein transglycosylase-like protein
MDRVMRCAMVAWLVFAASCRPTEAPSADPSEPTSPAAVAHDEAQPSASPRTAGSTATVAPSPPAPVVQYEPLALDGDQLARARKVQRYVRAAAAEYEIDPNLLNGIIWAESKFQPRARNRSGARGLMQLMPKTSQAMAKQMARPNRPDDPEFSIAAGACLLSILLSKFDGDEELALFGYARGSGSVRAWQSRGETEIPEGVRKFIERVRRARATFAALNLAG